MPEESPLLHNLMHNLQLRGLREAEEDLRPQGKTEAALIQGMVGVVLLLR